jgi:hypothetical protein
MTWHDFGLANTVTDKDAQVDFKRYAIINRGFDDLAPININGELICLTVLPRNTWAPSRNSRVVLTSTA